MVELDEDLIESILKPRKSRIFKDARFLQPLSPPLGGRPIGRDEELKALATLLSDVLRTGVGRNVFIYGKSGTGKTLCIKYLLEKIKKHAKSHGLNLSAVYVNAGRTRSPYYTMVEVVRGVGVCVPVGGWQMCRLKQAFEKVLETNSIMVAVDEVDTILQKQREPLIYYLNRLGKVTLILISNHYKDIASLPERARSTLQPIPIKFGSYTKEEAKEILAERVEKAFHKGVVSEELLDWVAEVVSKLGDIRLGFNIFLTAGLLAEREGNSRIQGSHIRRSMAALRLAI